MNYNQYKRNQDETALNYIGRMCSVKNDLGLTWEELAQILNAELNENLSVRSYRRRYNEWLSSIAETQEESESLTFDEILNIKKERIKLQDELSQINNLVRLQAREEAMMEMASEAAKEAAKIKVFDSPIKLIPKQSSLKEGILAIGDWHYGIDINVFYNVYNPAVCRNRIKLLASKCLDIIEKENIEIVHVVNLGDMISGRIHLPLRINSRCDVVTQTMEVSELIAEFLSLLSEFVVVNYYSVSDNHSRVEPKKKESLQTESFSRIIDWYLIERLKANENITFYSNVYGDDICMFNVFDHTIVAVHGDKDKSNKVISNLTSFLQQHLDLILTAHLHHFSADESNETTRLCNGSLMGCDDFASNLRLNSKPSQLFIVSSEENVTECIYKINLS